MRRILVAAAGVLVLGGGLLLLPVGGGAVEQPGATAPREKSAVPLAEFPAVAPRRGLQLLFIHHSVGGRILADAGPPKAISDSIWSTHPEGGGLRGLLEKEGYQVHEASYGSEVGESTDLPDWLPKFRDQMDRLLVVDQQDRRLPEGQRNQIVVFKSCYPNNDFGDDASVEHAQAELRALLPLFEARPDVLFLYLTAPPLAPRIHGDVAWKVVARTLLGKADPKARRAASGPRARRFNDWVTRPDGWLSGYARKNVAAFDLYGTLTDGKGDFLAWPTGDGEDSHPARAGNEKAAREIVPFINRAAQRSGLFP